MRFHVCLDCMAAGYRLCQEALCTMEWHAAEIPQKDITRRTCDEKQLDPCPTRYSPSQTITFCTVLMCLVPFEVWSCLKVQG